MEINKSSFKKNKLGYYGCLATGVLFFLLNSCENYKTPQNSQNKLDKNAGFVSLISDSKIPSSGMTCNANDAGSIANSYIKEGKYNEAIELLLATKDSLLKSKDDNIEDSNAKDDYLGNVYDNLGILYNCIKDTSLSIQYYEKAINIAKITGNSRNLLFRLNNLSTTYLNLGQYNKAISLLKEADMILKKNPEILGNDNYSIYLIYINLSNSYVGIGNYLLAKPYFLKAKQIITDYGFSSYEKASMLTSEADFAIYEKNYPQAFYFYKEALLLYKENGDLDGESWVLNAMKKLSLSLNDYSMAYSYQEQEYDVYKKIKSIEADSVRSKIETKYKTKDLQQQNITKQAQLEAQKAQLEAQKAKNRVAWGGAAAAILAALGAAGFVRKLNQKNKELQKQKDSMKASITYASGIQKAILSNENCLYGHFPESFVYMSPKDIVSGDFYFTGESPDGKKILVVADCTGHGVPAAFLTILGKTSIQGTIKNVKQPSEILTSLDSFFANQYKTSESAMDSAFADSMTHNDAMDVSVVYFDPKTKELQWSSSCNPIFVLRNGNLSTLKHQVRASIGSSVRPSSFTGYETSSYMLQPGDEVFLFSDGMSDQFGGATGKKLLLRGFKTLLVKLASVPLAQRSDYIRAYFEAFRKKEDGKLVSQTDDMILVGFRV